MSDTAYLILENGKIFKGKFFGAERDVTGEVVFTTGMTGYLETLTDNSYCGQLVVQTFPLIGNYGVIPSDFESPSVKASAYIVKHWCQEPSNFRSEGDLDTFLKAQNIVGLCGIDTRALTKIIRESGVMNGRITKDPGGVDLDDLKSFAVLNAVPGVSTDTVTPHKSMGGKYKVALMDYGLKFSIARELLKRDCDIRIFPHNSTPADILAAKPDGIMLSNGPGDPLNNPEIIANLAEISKSGIPIFGICLGHQLLAIANGFERKKLKYGHRGANHPVKELASGRVYITSQNHGYAIISGSAGDAVAGETFTSVNDGTCEGLDYTDFPAFSVQFHPEASAGPQDTAFLFDRFTQMMEVYKNAVR